MRNYYNAELVLADEPTTIVERKRLHWSTYEALIRGFPDSWRPGLRRMLLNAIQAKSIKRVFGIIQILDGHLTEYGVSDKILTVKLDRQAACFLKKYPFTDRESPFDTKTNARNQWLKAEAQCKATNERLRGDHGPVKIPRVVHRAKKLILDCLGGDLTDDRLREILTKGKHGPGSTLTNSCEDGEVTLYYKYNTLPYSCTNTGANYAFIAIADNHQWTQFLESSGRRHVLPDYRAPRAEQLFQLFGSCVEIRDTEKVTYVDKNAKTKRTIGIGGNLDMLCQLGIKSELQNCLLSVGVDLSNQDNNKSMAQQGSEFAYLFDGTENENQYSTLDLAMASDTISYELVKLLLPSYWFAVLDDLRFKRGRLDGENVLYEKFSAMGNGFTFPLESLIFWALTKASILEAGFSAKISDLAVYGDDIIVRKKAYHAVVHTLEWAGFSLNHEKSFYKGWFKESCGGDYFKGQDVRPFYLKRKLDTFEDIYFLANTVSRFAKLRKLVFGYHSLYSYLLTCIPADRIRYGPIATADTHLQVPLSYMRKQGLTPWLTPQELKLSKRVARVKGTQYCHDSPAARLDPWYFSFRRVAATYKGKSRLKLMMVLSYSNGVLQPEKWESLNDILNRKAAARGVVTRKGKTRDMVTLQTHSSWNGLWSSQQLRAHPVWGCR